MTMLAESPIDADATVTGGGRRCRIAAHWRGLAVGAALVVATAVTSGLYLGQYRPDQQTAASASAAVSAASDASVALLSYAPDTIDRDLATAKSRLTGEFLTYYGEFADQVVAPAAKEKAVVATAAVVRAASVEVSPGHAKVLVFLNQTTTSRDHPEPAQTASSVMVGLTDVGQKWLVSSFDPL